MHSFTSHFWDTRVTFASCATPAGLRHECRIPARLMRVSAAAAWGHAWHEYIIMFLGNGRARVDTRQSVSWGLAVASCLIHDYAPRGYLSSTCRCRLQPDSTCIPVEPFMRHIAPTSSLALTTWEPCRGISFKTRVSGWCFKVVSVPFCEYIFSMLHAFSNCKYREPPGSKNDREKNHLKY